jgi:type 1 glutamine amidotransferase
MRAWATAAWIIGLLLSTWVAAQQPAAPAAPAGAGAAQAAPPAQDPWPGRKKVLAIGDARTSFQHDSVSHALATIERLGRESGAFVTVIRTDSQLITKSPIPRPALNTKNLDFFDAIFFFGAGPGDLTPQQMQDLLAFVRDDGKGFVAAHTGDNAFQPHPEYANMIGGAWDHPWTRADRLVANLPITVEDPAFPAMSSLPPAFQVVDEVAVHKAPYARGNVRVLASLDFDKVDRSLARDPRDTDVPVAWAKPYGKGRVFYSVLGHSDESWDNPLVQRMFVDALRWATGLVPGDASPRR